MSKFRPYLGLGLTVGQRHFEFIPHPLFPGDREAVFIVEGGEAFIYQIRDVSTKGLYAGV